MKEIIQQIIDCEEQGRQVITKAQAEANKSLQQAKIKAESILQTNIEKIKIMAQQKKAESLKIVTSEKEKILNEFKQKIAEKRQAREKDVPALAKKMFEKIIKIEE